MRKYLGNDRNSNMNTSCASEESELSSTYETNISESLFKLDELKKLYLETCHEETIIQNENIQLKVQLERSQQLLNSLLAAKFGPQKQDPPYALQHAHTKSTKAGSITKIKRGQEERAFEQLAHEPERESKDGPERLFRDGQQRQDSGCSPRPNNHGNQDSLLEQKTEFYVMKNEKLCFEKGGETKHQYRYSMDFNADKPNQYTYDSIKTTPWSKENQWEKKQNWKETNIKSYLSSPRRSAIGSPRNMLMG